MHKRTHTLTLIHFRVSQIRQSRDPERAWPGCKIFTGQWSPIRHVCLREAMMHERETVARWKRGDTFHFYALSLSLSLSSNYDRRRQQQCAFCVFVVCQRLCWGWHTWDFYLQFYTGGIDLWWTTAVSDWIRLHDARFLAFYAEQIADVGNTLSDRV